MRRIRLMPLRRFVQRHKRGILRVGLAVFSTGVLSIAFAPTAFGATSTSTIVVSSSLDVVNGDISSVAALVADPGPDGISLREAIEATNNSPGTYIISFAPSLADGTISLLSQLPPLTGGGVTINGDINGDGQPDVTLEKSPSFVLNGNCPSTDGCGVTVASSQNSINALTMSGFGVGVDIDPPPVSATQLTSHQTFDGNTVSNTDMQNIQQFGVVMGSMYLPGCGLFGGSATPCTTDDTWSNTTITGNTIASLDTAIGLVDSDAGDAFSNTTIANNTIAIQGADAAISVHMISNATGSTVSGVVISHNTITGVTGQGINVGPGGSRAYGNSMTNVQILDNTVNLVSTGTDLCCQGIVILAGTDTPAATDPNVLPLGYPDSNSLSNVLVQGNVVTGTLTTGIQVVAGLGAGGSFNTISEVAIDANQVTTTTEANGIWIVNGGGNPLGGRIATSNNISAVSIDANRVTTGTVPLQPASGYGAINIDGGGDPSKSNSISAVSLVNNVVTSSNSSMLVVGGEDKDGLTSANSVRGVQLVNNTIVNPSGNVLNVSANEDGNSSSVITGLSVVNCILWGSIVGVTASTVHHSLVGNKTWAKENGNVTGNPKFVNAAKGNYELAKTSPARGKGTATGAPTADIVGHLRPKKHVDIGAYQDS